MEPTTSEFQAPESCNCSVAIEIDYGLSKGPCVQKSFYCQFSLSSDQDFILSMQCHLDRQNFINSFGKQAFMFSNELVVFQSNQNPSTLIRRLDTLTKHFQDKIEMRNWTLPRFQCHHFEMSCQTVKDLKREKNP